MNTPSEICRLCGDRSISVFYTESERVYWKCLKCHVVFLHHSYFLDSHSEYQRYLTHKNNPADPDYRNFLNKLCEPLLKKLVPESSGLDYGCGPGPALAHMLAEAGHRMKLYDPFFHNYPGSLNLKYDFITCTETVEHFHNPAQEFLLLNSLLRAEGWLAIMTSLLSDETDFASWYYRKDPTHVIFYTKQSFQHLSEIYNWKLESPAENVILLQKKSSSEYIKSE